jgi:hypothetical protein
MEYLDAADLSATSCRPGLKPIEIGELSPYFQGSCPPISYFDTAITWQASGGKRSQIF